MGSWYQGLSAFLSGAAAMMPTTWRMAHGAADTAGTQVMGHMASYPQQQD